jgi:hypothetical protein
MPLSTAKAKLRMTLAVWITGRLAPSVVNLMRCVMPSAAARPRMPPTMRLMPVVVVRCLGAAQDPRIT